MKKIIFRADANKAIGMGHIMRTLSIADAFSSAHCEVEFIIADDTVASLIQDRGYNTTVLRSQYDHMDDELELWPIDLHADYLIVDSYYVTPSYFGSLRERLRTDAVENSKLVYIDDVLRFPYPVDILIDYGVYASASAYHDLYKNSREEGGSDDPVEEPEFILGATYTPLRSMFRGIPRRLQSEEVKHILISTGGSDELHLTLALINEIVAKKDKNDTKVRSNRIYHFLIGAMNEDKEEIKRVASEVEWVQLHENVQNMKALISSMDEVVSAAGSTTYEISACGVPLITYSLADNQISGGEAFERFGLGLYIGDLRDPGSINPDLVMSGSLATDAVERILTATDILASDYTRRVTIGAKMQELIDGCGAERMVQRILSV